MYLNTRFVLCIFLLFFNLLPAHSQLKLSLCENSESEWLRRKSQLEIELSGLPSGKLLDKDDLKRIIFPEYIAFDPDLNIMEKGLIKFFFGIGVDKFKRISIGPFQMQLQFINMLIGNISEESLEDPILNQIKNEGYDVMIANINYLAEIKTQWKLLLMYEDYCIKRKILSEKNMIDGMINFYNSGKVNDNNITFSKIKCEKKTYLFWSKYITSL